MVNLVNNLANLLYQLNSENGITYFDDMLLIYRLSKANVLNIIIIICDDPIDPNSVNDRIWAHSVAEVVA